MLFSPMSLLSKSIMQEEHIDKLASQGYCDEGQNTLSKYMYGLVFLKEEPPKLYRSRQTWQSTTCYAQVLNAALVPFVKSAFPDSHHLYQDNNPKHTSQWAQWYFQEKGINWWPTPAENPDINPIECVWGTTKEAVCNHYKPRTLNDLEAAIKHFWETKMTPDACAR